MPVALSITIAELVESVLAATSIALGPSVTSMTADLPVEAVLARGASWEPAVLIGPSSWRWRTDFDREPGRLRVTVDLAPATPLRPGSRSEPGAHSEVIT